MNIFDKFFTKFSYKFDKGYPDMDNPKDVLLLESLISEVIGERYSLEEANMVGPATNYPSEQKCLDGEMYQEYIAAVGIRAQNGLFVELVAGTNSVAVIWQ